MVKLVNLSKFNFTDFWFTHGHRVGGSPQILKLKIDSVCFKQYIYFFGTTWEEKMVFDWKFSHSFSLFIAIIIIWFESNFDGKSEWIFAEMHKDYHCMGQWHSFVPLACVINLWILHFHFLILCQFFILMIYWNKNTKIEKRSPVSSIVAVAIADSCLLHSITAYLHWWLLFIVYSTSSLMDNWKKLCACACACLSGWFIWSILLVEWHFKSMKWKYKWQTNKFRCCSTLLCFANVWIIFVCFIFVLVLFNTFWFASRTNERIMHIWKWWIYVSRGCINNDLVVRASTTNTQRLIINRCRCHNGNLFVGSMFIAFQNVIHIVWSVIWMRTKRTGYSAEALKLQRMENI